MVPVECICGKRDSVQLKNLERTGSSSCRGCWSDTSHHRVDADIIADDKLRRYWRNRWLSIVERCTDPRAAKYHCYGGRGISYSWKNQREFLTWIKTLDGWDRVLETRATLDREDNDGNYEPGNIRLTDFRTNQQNKRGSVVVSTPIGPCSGGYLKDKFGLRAHPDSISKWILEGCTFEDILARDKYAGTRGRDTGKCVRRAECGPEV